MAWQHHFEFLNLGYAADLYFFGFCKEQFPRSGPGHCAHGAGRRRRPVRARRRTEKAGASSGRDRRRRGLDERIGRSSAAAVAGRPNGKNWIDAWNVAKYPWFNFTSGNGFYSEDKYRIEHLDIPLSYARNCISQVRKGMKIERPTAGVAAECERITKEYGSRFPKMYGLCSSKSSGGADGLRVENHNFYIEFGRSGFSREDAELSGLFMSAASGLIRKGCSI